MTTQNCGAELPAIAVGHRVDRGAVGGQPRVGEVRAEDRQLGDERRQRVAADAGAALEQAVERRARRLELAGRTLARLARHGADGHERAPRRARRRPAAPRRSATRASRRRCHGSRGPTGDQVMRLRSPPPASTVSAEVERRRGALRQLTAPGAPTPIDERQGPATPGCARRPCSGACRARTRRSAS